MQEEWVVCRVFQKSTSLKKPQQTTTSSQQQQQTSIESPCDETNSIVNEFGDIELPNLNSNSIANSSSGLISTMSSTQSCYNNNINDRSSDVNMSLNMNWGAAREAAASALPTLTWPWPSNLLTPSNLSVNSLLLRALQLRSSNTGAATLDPSYSYNNNNNNINMEQGMPRPMSQFGSGTSADMNSNFQASSSTRDMMEAVPPQQHPEQPFNLDSLWWGFSWPEIEWITYITSCKRNATIYIWLTQYTDRLLMIYSCRSIDVEK